MDVCASMNHDDVFKVLCRKNYSLERFTDILIVFSSLISIRMNLENMKKLINLEFMQKKTRICKKNHLRLVFFDVCFFCKKNIFFIKKTRVKKTRHISMQDMGPNYYKLFSRTGSLLFTRTLY